MSSPAREDNNGPDERFGYSSPDDFERKAKRKPLVRIHEGEARDHFAPIWFAAECRSYAGRWRARHDWDADGCCLFCGLVDREQDRLLGAR